MARHLWKKTMKWESGVFPCHGMAELPRILFGHAWARQLKKHETGPHRIFFEKTEGFSAYMKTTFSLPSPFLCMIFAEITFCPSINLEQPVMVLVLFFSYVSAKLQNALPDFIRTYEFTGFKRESSWAAFCTAAFLFNEYIFKYYVFIRYLNMLCILAVNVMSPRY